MRKKWRGAFYCKAKERSPIINFTKRELGSYSARLLIARRYAGRIVKDLFDLRIGERPAQSEKLPAGWSGEIVNGGGHIYDANARTFLDRLLTNSEWPTSNTNRNVRASVFRVLGDGNGGAKRLKKGLPVGLCYSQLYHYMRSRDRSQDA